MDWSQLEAKSALWRNLLFSHAAFHVHFRLFSEKKPRSSAILGMAKQKARQLFLPSVVNSIVFSLLIYFTICQGWSHLKPIWYHQALWYLNTLFAFVVVARIIAICRNSSVRVFLWMLFYGCTFFLNFYPIGMYLKFMLPFFLLGISYRKLTNFKASLQYYILVPGALLAVWVFPMWNFSHSIYMLPYAPLDPENISIFSSSMPMVSPGFVQQCYSSTPSIPYSLARKVLFLSSKLQLGLAPSLFLFMWCKRISLWFEKLLMVSLKISYYNAPLHSRSSPSVGEFIAR